MIIRKQKLKNKDILNNKLQTNIALLESPIC